MAALIAFGMTAGSAQAQTTNPPPVQADAFSIEAPSAQAEAGATFDILAFQVRGNTILPADTVERTILPFMGPGKTESDVESARAALQKAFEDAGYVAVSVFIPEQSVDGGVLSLEVQPQRVGQLLVEGDTRSADQVRAQAQSVAPGQTPNLPAFQRDVVALNSNPNRRVTPELRAGVAPGTLDVVLTVEETSPIHGSVEVNNFSSAATTDLRTAATLRYDDLLGRGDSISVSAQTAPRRTDDGTVFSANWLTRLGQGRQLMLYGVHSDSDIAVVGGTSVIGRGNMAGLRFIQSLGSSEGFYHSLTLGIDWKDFDEDVILGPDRASAPIQYFPFMASWRGDWTTDRTRSDVTFSTVFGIRGLGDGRERFDAKRYNARPSFVTFKLDASRTEEVMAGMQFHSRVTGQWSPDPLISNEGFSLGGMSSVRGYYETEHIADYGVAIQTELRSPDFGPRLGGPIDELRLHAFWDSGIGAIHDPLQGQDKDFGLSSIGLGGRIRLFRYLNGGVDFGIPLVNGSESRRGDFFTRFRIWGEF